MHSILICFSYQKIKLGFTWKSHYTQTNEFTLWSCMNHIQFPHISCDVELFLFWQWVQICICLWAFIIREVRCLSSKERHDCPMKICLNVGVYNGKSGMSVELRWIQYYAFYFSKFCLTVHHIFILLQHLCSILRDNHAVVCSLHMSKYLNNQKGNYAVYRNDKWVLFQMSWLILLLKVSDSHIVHRILMTVSPLNLPLKQSH